MAAALNKKSIGIRVNNLKRLLTQRVSKLTLQQLLPPILFMSVALVIMLPLLSRGYILHYDMVFGPYVHINWEAIKSGEVTVNSVVQLGILKFASFILPMDIVQKIILLAILFFSGYLMYRIIPVQSMEARLLAGLLYQINPFIYDRFMAGHWLFLIGYSLTPLALLSFMKFFKNPSRRSMFVAALIWAAIAIISPHHLLILGVLWLSLAVFYIRSLMLLLYSLGLLVMVAIFSSWWLLPLLLIPNFTQSFGYEHFYAFATKPDIEYGLWLTLLSLQGFWYQGWATIKDFISWWPLVWIGVVAPITVGLIVAFKMKGSEYSRPVTALLIASVVALLLSAGPAPGLYAINLWLFENVPGLSGMRESQKFLSLLALTYAFLLAVGVDFILRRSGRIVNTVVVTMTALVITAMAWPLFYGGQGQLQTTHYPASWHKIHKYLESEDPEARVLVLPWSIYLEDTFADRLVANPARSYFDSQMLHSQHTHLPGISNEGDERYSDIDKAFTAKDVSLLQKAIRNHDIKYVMIVKSRESPKLQWVKKADFTEAIIVENPTSFYRVKNN